MRVALIATLPLSFVCLLIQDGFPKTWGFKTTQMPNSHAGESSRSRSRSHHPGQKSMRLPPTHRWDGPTPAELNSTMQFRRTDDGDYIPRGGRPSFNGYFNEKGAY